MSSSISRGLLSKQVFLFDCDGVLWQTDRLVNGAADLLKTLRRLNRRFFLITNKSSKSRAQYLSKCQSLGLPVNEQDIMCTAYAAAQYLKNSKYAGKLYLLGAKGLADELDAAGIRHCGQGADTSHPQGGTGFEGFDAVELEDDVTGVLLAFDRDFSIVKLLKASSYITRGGDFFASNEDAFLPSANGKLRIPGTGALLASLTCASSRQPDVVFGKPHAPMLDLIHHQLTAEGVQVPRERWVMVGDRLDTDVAFANSHGIESACVLTGVSTASQVEATTDKLLKPTFVFDSVKDINELLNSSP